MNSLGPFPMRAVLVAAAALLAWWLVRLLARRWGGSHTDASTPKLADALFTDAFLVGLLAARLGCVVRWWPEYTAAPWSIVAIGDVRAGSTKRVAAAVGEGAQVVATIHAFLADTASRLASAPIAGGSNG